MTRNGKKRRKIIGFCFVYVIGVVKALKLKHGRSDFLSKFSLWFLEFGTQSVSFYCRGTDKRKRKRKRKHGMIE